MGMTLLFAFALVVVSAMMIQAHLDFWEAKKQDPEVTAAELQFFRSQFRRRVVTSGLIGVAGCAVAASDYVTDPTGATFWWYWGILGAGVVVLGILATLDMRHGRSGPSHNSSPMDEHKTRIG